MSPLKTLFAGVLVNIIKKEGSNSSLFFIVHGVLIYTILEEIALSLIFGENGESLSFLIGQRRLRELPRHIADDHRPISFDRLPFPQS